MIIGSRVECIKEVSGPYYPPLGTLGAVRDVLPGQLLVQWDSGVSKRGIAGSRTWYCSSNWVRQVDDYTNYNLID